MSFFKSSAPAQNDRETISTERSPRPRIRILHFLEFKLLDLCCQFPNNQINQQDTGRVLLLSKSVGVLCRANRKPRSTSSKYILIILIGSNPFWHRGLETILHSTSYQDGVEYGWRMALHGIPSESSLSNVCFGHKQETNCLRRAESFLYGLALSTNCYLGVLNVFFFSNVLSFVFPFQRGSGKKVWQSKCDDEKPQWNGESSVSQGENKGLCTFFNCFIM